MAKKKQKVLQVPNYIRNSAKALSFFSDNWATKFAFKLFVTPVKFPMPKREIPMDTFSIQYPLQLAQCKKDIHVYENGKGNKKALVVHGWNGRGTQLFSIVKLLTQLDYTVISFDAPGHGKASKNKTQMIDFMEACFTLEHKYNGFDLVVGHSLGGMTVMNCLSRGLKSEKAIIIGSGDVIDDVIHDFVQSVGLPPRIDAPLKKYFETKYQDELAHYTVHEQALKINIPILVIHDKNDLDVSYTAAENIVSHLQHGTLLLTEKLGHRKILGDPKVLQSIKTFILDENV